jgi:hypothetical protein
MPEDWFQERRGVEELLRARTLIADAWADAATGHLGLLRHGTWRAVHRFGGGQSVGYLYVLLDPVDEKVIDVS